MCFLFVRLRELEDQLQGLEASKPPAAPELKFKVCNGINKYKENFILEK